MDLKEELANEYASVYAEKVKYLTIGLREG